MVFLLRQGVLEQTIRVFDVDLGHRARTSVEYDTSETDRSRSSVHDIARLTRYS